MQNEVILTQVKHPKWLMARKRNKSHSLHNYQQPQKLHRALLATSKSIKQTLSSQWNVWKRYYCLSLGRTPLSNICLDSDAHTYNHSFMHSSANKTFLPEVIQLITGIFIFSHRLKIKSLVQLYKHSQSPYWQTESTYLSITIANY